jgi:hypothetical protein
MENHSVWNKHLSITILKIAKWAATGSFFVVALLFAVSLRYEIEVTDGHFGQLVVYPSGVFVTFHFSRDSTPPYFNGQPWIRLKRPTPSTTSRLRWYSFQVYQFIDTNGAERFRLVIGIPYLTAVVSLMFQRLASRGLVRASRQSKNQCVHCGYDLRGATAEKCSECGNLFCSRSAKPVAGLFDVKSHFAIYLWTGVLVSVFTTCSYAAPWHWWKARYAFTDFMIQMAGVAGLAIDWLASFPLGIGEPVFAAVIVLAIWFLWAQLLVKTRLGVLPSGVHFSFAVTWFLIGKLLVLFLLWINY